MRINDLFETPIEDFSLHGDWSRNSSFRHEQDRKLLSNPKAQTKVIQKWAKTSVPFNMMFVNSPEVNKELHTEVGEVTQEWLNEHMPKTAAEIKINPEAVNIIFTNNKASERAPMTAWVMAHRWGHALRMGGKNWFYKEITNELKTTIKDILKHVYSMSMEQRISSGYSYYMKINEPLMTAFYAAIGTMRSARDNEIRNADEFIHELLAQYIISGKITFNPLPKFFKYGRHDRAFMVHDLSEHDVEYYNGMLETLAESLSDTIETMMGNCIGKIYVM